MTTLNHIQRKFNQVETKEKKVAVHHQRQKFKMAALELEHVLSPVLFVLPTHLSEIFKILIEMGADKWPYISYIQNKA